MRRMALALACLLPVAAVCEDRYGYPEYRPHRYDRSFVLTVLGEPRIHYIPDVRIYDPHLYAPVRAYEAPPEPRRWYPAPCRMQGPFAVDWRETCRSKTR